jgi:hypothetical protein
MTALARPTLLILALLTGDSLRGWGRAAHTPARRTVNSVASWGRPALDEPLATDSGFFDATGFYVPHPVLTPRGHYFSFIDIKSIEPNYEVRVEFEEGGNVRSRHDCPKPLITRDTLDIRCPGTPLGVLRVAGTFLDKRGRFWNRNDVVDNETIVLVARVTVESRGRVTFSEVVQFAYSGGD